MLDALDTLRIIDGGRPGGGLVPPVQVAAAFYPVPRCWALAKSPANSHIQRHRQTLAGKRADIDTNERMLTGTGAERDMTRIIQPGHTFFGAGTLAASGTILVEASAGPGLGGAIEVLGAATNNGMVDFYGGVGPGSRAATGTVGVLGVLTNIGTITFENGGNASDAYGAGASALVQGVLVNQGLLRLGGTDDTSIGGGARLSIAAGGTLSNELYLELLPSSSGVDRPAGAPSSAPTLIDAGVLTNNGDLQLFSAVSFNAASAAGAVLDVTGVLINNNEVYLHGGYNVGYFADTMATGSTLVVGGSAGYLLNVASIVVAAGAGIFPVDSLAGEGAVLQVDASLVNTGNIFVEGSRGDYVGNGSGNGLADVPPGGTLAVAGTLTNSGRIFIGEGYAYAGHVGGAGGVLSVTGVLLNSGTLVGPGGNAGASPGGGAALGIGPQGYLDNTGSILLGAGFDGVPSGAGATLTIGSLLENAGYLYLGSGENAAEVSITATGYLDDTGTIAGAGTIVNDNIFALSSNVAIYAGAVVNSGLIDSGVYSNPILAAPILTAPGGAGTIFIDGGSTLTFLDAVAAGQSVVFSNDYAPYGLFPSIALGDATAFSGVLTDLFAGASIDFLGLDVTSATASGTTLTVDIAGGGTLDLALDAPLAAGLGFALTADSTGGTELTVVAHP